jgi:BioD-like phosphotransacetylase family protein
MELIKHRFKKCECLGETRPDIWQIPISQVRVISLPNEYLNMERYLKPQNVVIIGAGSKNRLKRIIEFNRSQPKRKKLAGIVLTCGESTDLYEESRIALENSDVPGLYVNEDTAQAEDLIKMAVENTKIQVFDKHKYEEIKTLFQEHFDFERLVEELQL